MEIILSIAALFNGLYDVVRASLLGSILSNLLLVTGGSPPPSTTRLGGLRKLGLGLG